MIRSWLGNPKSVYAKTIRDPAYAHLAATKTIAILDYGEHKRVSAATNHRHNFGLHHQESHIQIEGAEGSGRMKMGVLLGYPVGEPDSVEYAKREADTWVNVSISGNNFPDGFMGIMGHCRLLFRKPPNRCHVVLKMAFRPMALVEALYCFSAREGETLEWD